MSPVPDLLTSIAGAPPAVFAPSAAGRPVRRMRLAPVLAVEAALLVAAGAATAGAPAWLAAVLAVLGVAAAAARWRGRWGWDWLRLWLQLRARRRRSGRIVAPPPAVEAFADRSATTFGVVAGGGGLGALLAVHGLAGPPGLDLLATALNDRGVRLAWLQLVVAYPGEPGGGAQVTVALRLRPGDCPAAVLARGGGVAGARRALGAAAARLGRRLADHGHAARVLDPTAVAAAVAAPPAGLPVDEHWDHCVVDGVRYTGYAVSRWPAYPAAFLAALGTLPASGVVASVLLLPGEHAPRLRGVVRVAAAAGPPAGGPDLDAALGELAAHFGAALVRLDGEHARAVAHTVAGATE
jgi:type VII secretion protein EccE